MPVFSGKSKGEIENSKLLLVEGKDETIFFEALLKERGVLDNIQIVEVGGTSKFKTELPAILARTGFSDNVESIAIVRDADSSFHSAFQSVCNLLAKYDLPYPVEPNQYAKGENLKVGVFIMPGNPEFGNMLEDLCLKTQSENPIMECVNLFFNCLEGKNIEMPRNIPKAKSQVFLAAMPKIVNTLGLGAQKNYWDLNHHCLWELHKFLNEL